jgi:hypothetical protein
MAIGAIGVAAHNALIGKPTQTPRTLYRLLIKPTVTASKVRPATARQTLCACQRKPV